MAVKETESKPVSLYNRAFKAFESERFGEARELFTQLLTEHSETSFCAANRAMIHTYMRRAGLLAADPSLELYFYEDFDVRTGRREGRGGSA